MQLLEFRLQLAADDGVGAEALHRLQPLLDLFLVEAGPQEPAALQPGPHRRGRPVEREQQGALDLLVQRVEQFQVADGNRVEDHPIRLLDESRSFQVRQSGALGVLEVVQQRSGGRDCQRVA